MQDKRFLRRLQAVFRRRKAKRASLKDKRRSKEPVIIHLPPAPPPVDNMNDNKTRTTKGSTLDEMRATADPQTLSPFFQHLPIEIRLKIYHQIWQSYLKPRRLAAGPVPNAGSDLRLHLYTPSPASRTLVHTRCKLHPGEPAQKDVSVMHDIHAEDWAAAPGWYRDAWVLRLNWGKHWKCQHAVQKRWDVGGSGSGEGRGLKGKAGEWEEGGERAPFLGVFLACKRMYLEAAQSLFETVTLVFTSSTDAYQFFMVQPHPFLPHLRNLELSLAYINDHLFLSKILHEGIPPRPSTQSTGGSNINNNTHDDIPHSTAALGPSTNISQRGSSTAAPASAPEDITLDGPSPAKRNSKVCFNLNCRLDVFGAELWPFLIKGIRTAAPGLRELDVEVGGRIESAAILDCFGRVVEDEASVAVGGSGGSVGRGGDGGVGDEERETSEMEETVPTPLDAAGGREMWALPGRLMVVFSGGSVKRGYVQAGKRMVRVEVDED